MTLLQKAKDYLVNLMGIPETECKQQTPFVVHNKKSTVSLLVSTCYTYHEFPKQLKSMKEYQRQHKDQYIYGIIWHPCDKMFIRYNFILNELEKTTEGEIIHEFLR